MNLKYIIAMDFEANYSTTGSVGPHEIIEFPAVLMDITNGRVLDEFREFVKPTSNSTLSQDCRNLTGIAQRDIDRADSLKKVLDTFDNWLRIQIRDHNLDLNNGNCAFVTWGDDFKQFLIPECKRKGYTVPSYFLKWANLRTTYNSKYNAGLLSFKTALNNANVQLVGQWHSGINDAKNLANLARKLYECGYKITSFSTY